MPVFEYICMECEEEFEKLVFGNPKVECPKCGSIEITKKFSVFGMSGVEKPSTGSSNCSTCGSSGSACSSC